MNLSQLVLAAPTFQTTQVDTPGGGHLAAACIAARARDLAAALENAGAGPDEPVVLFISNSPEDLAGFLGIWLAKAVAVPVHITTPTRAIETLSRRLGSRFAIRDLAVETADRTAPTSRPLLRGAALIVFTSGSTGEPKGVVLSHRGLGWKLQILQRLLQVSKGETVAVSLQLTFIFGIWVSLLSLMSGLRLLLAPKLSASSLRRHAPAVSMLATVPTSLRSLCADISVNFPGLRKVLTGGEPFQAELAANLASRFPHAGVFDLFGLTETGSCDFFAVHKGRSDAEGTIGRPTEGIDYRIRHLPELDLPTGVGELQIRSPAVMSGYLDDPGQTAAVFDDGYFRTGDLVSEREDGYVELVGRSKDIVSRGGNKIAPLEIENVFVQHGGVAAALVFGMPDDKLGERLHMMVVSRDPTLDEMQLRAWSAERLERFKIPNVIHFVGSLPVGRTGKADRAAARTELSSHSVQGGR